MWPDLGCGPESPGGRPIAQASCSCTSVQADNEAVAPTDEQNVVSTLCHPVADGGEAKDRALREMILCYPACDSAEGGVDKDRALAGVGVKDLKRHSDVAAEG
jgi:hypothetical protein